MSEVCSCWADPDKRFWHRYLNDDCLVHDNISDQDLETANVHYLELHCWCGGFHKTRDIFK